jgi:hypothetical protein
LTVSNRRPTAHSAGEAITGDSIDLTTADANIGQLSIGEMFQLSAGACAGVPLGYGGSDTRKGLKKTTAHGDNPCVQGSKFDPEYGIQTTQCYRPGTGICAMQHCHFGIGFPPLTGANDDRIASLCVICPGKT